MSQPTTKSLPTTLRLIHSGQAAKVGQRAEGQIHYQLFTDLAQKELYFRLTGNDGGGYFSRELIAFRQVKAAVNHFSADTPFPSKVFRDAFTGKSSNNPGFLACLLRTEGLLSGVPDKTHQHLLAGNWKQWEAEQLAKAGEVINLAESNSAETPSTTSSDAPAGRKGRRRNAKEESSASEQSKEGGSGEAGGNRVEEEYPDADHS